MKADEASAERAPSHYTDLQVAGYGVRLVNGEPLSIVPDDLRPFFERAQELARASVAAQPPPAPVYETITLSPSVCELWRDVLTAAGCRPGEFSIWLREAERKDRAEREPRPAEPVARKPRLVGLNGGGLNPASHPQRGHLHVVRS